MNLSNAKYYLILFCLIIIVRPASGWYDETHLAVAKAAGYYKWYNAAGADIAKIKAGRIEAYNHFYNNSRKLKITPEIVLEQAGRYDNSRDSDGHLYGAIIASVREYQKRRGEGKYAEYHLAFCAHYIGDLSQPLHNMSYDGFNKTRHSANDGTVNREVFDNPGKIKERMHPVKLSSDNFEYDLAKEIAVIANNARELGDVLKRDKRNMTKKEAYIQIGRSASLLKAVLAHVDKYKK